MAANKELAYDISPLIRTYKDGTVDRLLVLPHAPPSSQHPSNGVSSKDVAISTHVSARLYLPNPTKFTNLPILVYFHGGGFVVGSAFTLFEHNYLNTLVSHINALTVSVEYRLAPEHLLPTAYDDCWAALQWVASHSTTNRESLNNPDPWLIEYGDFDRVYMGGDSAGGNIVHNMAMRAGRERLNGDVKIAGGFLGCPYFWGSKEGSRFDESVPYKCWMVSYPDAEGGIDNRMINPTVGGGGDMAGLGCRRLVVVVAEKDEMREKGVEYVKAIKESEWDGEVELVDVEGEGHCFYNFDSNCDKAKKLMDRLASFIA